MSAARPIIRLCALLAAGALVAGCSSTSSPSSSSGSGFGSTFKNMLLFNSATAPPAATANASLEGPECPPVSIADGGAALRTLSSKSAESDAVASQISIGETARECTATADGGIRVKVGVQGRVLLGPGGKAARFDAPLRFMIKRGDTVLVTRVQRISTAIPAGDTQATFVIVEDGLIVPPGAAAGEFDIEVGLGNAPSEGGGAKPRGRRKS